MDWLIITVLSGIAATYLLRSLLLEESDSHHGPFRDHGRSVFFSNSKHVQPVTLFDWVRRAFGVYEVTGKMWSVDTNREAVERFTCPHCLSWWTAIPFTVVIWVNHGSISALISHFAVAILSQWMYRKIYGEDQ